MRIYTFDPHLKLRIMDVQEKLDKYKGDALSQLSAAGYDTIDMNVLEDLAGRMKTMINNKDALLVAASDSSELETVRKNFVVKKLGVENEEKGMKAIHTAAEKLSANKFKNRAAFYYIVKHELGK